MKSWSHDLNSTNGTFVGGEKVTEATVKPGQILRLGQVEMRLETDTARLARPRSWTRHGDAARGKPQ